MSKNKKIVSVDPGTGAGAISEVRGENTLPCSAHGKKKLSTTLVEINGVSDGGYHTGDRSLPPLSESRLGGDAVKRIADVLRMDEDADMSGETTSAPIPMPTPPFPAHHDLNIAEQYPTTYDPPKDVPAGTEEFVDRTVKSAVENTLGLDMDKPASSGEPTAVGAALSDDVVKQIMQSVPGLSEEDVRSMEEDEIQLFTDLLEMNAAMKEVAVDLQKSADQGGPSSVVGFFRFYMALTKIGVNELAAQTGIIRLRLTSILQETVDMTPGEMTKIKEVLLPRYMRWKELQDRPENKTRLEAREKKRMEKKRKKSRSYDPITGMAR